MGITAKPVGKLKRIYKRLENDLAKREKEAKERREKNGNKRIGATKETEDAEGKQT